MEACLDYLEKLVNDILDLSKLESGTAKITFEEWISIIDKMLDFFKRYCDDDIDVDARKDEGFKLFCEYFEFLWW